MAFEGALTAPGSVAIRGLGARKVLGQNVGLRVQKAGRRGAQLIPGDSCRLSLIPGSTGATGAGRGGTRGREGPFPRPVLLRGRGPAAWWSPQFLVCSLAGPAGSSGDPAFRGRGEGRSQARQGGHSLKVPASLGLGVAPVLGWGDRNHPTEASGSSPATRVLPGPLSWGEDGPETRAGLGTRPRPPPPTRAAAPRS